MKDALISERNKEIAKIMKSDWDRRIAHDYRFWMSDGVISDDEMWRTGERDYSILLGDIQNKDQKTALEIGCGVGRILKSTARYFKEAIGIDISEKGIKKAEELLNDISNISLYQVNGFDLKNIKNDSIDVVYSFAALTSIPVEIISQYILETHRILKKDGLF